MNVLGVSEEAKSLIERNQELHKLSRTLLLLAKANPGFRSLKGIGVRRMVFAFFLPEGCVLSQAFRHLY